MMRSSRLLMCVATAGAVTLAAGCSSAAPQAHRSPALPPGPRYYVSLGDSLSQGVQPSIFGTSRPTAAGYPDKLFAVLRAKQPAWRLTKLGCSGETTGTMIRGGICHYPTGSQLTQAKTFLRAHRGHIGLITIDIGANDPNNCLLGAVPASKIFSCMNTSIKGTETDLRKILRGLRGAAGQSVPIIAMSYYVPELS